MQIHFRKSISRSESNSMFEINSIFEHVRMGKKKQFHCMENQEMKTAFRDHVCTFVLTVLCILSGYCWRICFRSSYPLLPWQPEGRSDNASSFRDTARSRYPQGVPLWSVLQISSDLLYHKYRCVSRSYPVLVKRLSGAWYMTVSAILYSVTLKRIRRSSSSFTSSSFDDRQAKHPIPI